MPEIAQQRDKIASLAKQIKVTPVGESELFRILYACRDPKRAASLVNAVTESYFDLRDQCDTERNRRVIEMLMQERDVAPRRCRGSAIACGPWPSRRRSGIRLQARWRPRALLGTRWRSWKIASSRLRWIVQCWKPG